MKADRNDHTGDSISRLQKKLRRIVITVFAGLFLSTSLTGCVPAVSMTITLYQELLKQKELYEQGVREMLGYIIGMEEEELSIESLMMPGLPVPGGQYLVEVCPPYQTVHYSENLEFEPYKMNGKEYDHGFCLDTNIWATGEADYNLDGKYSVLEFDVGHKDGADQNGSTFYFYLDGELKMKVPVTGNMMAEHKKLALNQAKQMIIKADSYSGNYALANVTIR